MKGGSIGGEINGAQKGRRGPVPPLQKQHSAPIELKKLPIFDSTLFYHFF